jgi:exonuclease SbcD
MMRVVHTADWHVGRVWKNLSRLDETARVLEHLAGYLERERVDLLLVAGDVFDTPNPGADAEQLVFQFFRRLGARQIPAVVIAGNHDNAGRMEAYGQLAELAGVRVIGRPRAATKGGVVRVTTSGGEMALVAALPFAAPGVFASALELAGDETVVKARYAEMFKGAVAHLATAFRPDRVNLLMAHTHLDGAVLANSERVVHLGEDWAATPQALPNTAQYVALGHIHKPQRVESSPAPAEYAGSPLQLDFGEAAQAKSFVVIDVKPGRPARVQRIPLEGGKGLHDLRLTLPELEERAEQLRTAGWLRVTVPLSEPDPDLNRKVRELVPNALTVHAELPDVPLPAISSNGRSPVEMYAEYHQRQHGRPPEPGVSEAFQQLYEQCDPDQDHGN